MSQSNITPYWKQHERQNTKLRSDHERKKDTPHLALSGELWDAPSEFFGEIFSEISRVHCISSLKPQVAVTQTMPSPPSGSRIIDSYDRFDITAITRLQGIPIVRSKNTSDAEGLYMPPRNSSNVSILYNRSLKNVINIHYQRNFGCSKYLFTKINNIR